MLQKVNAAILFGLCATLAACGEEPTSSNPSPSATPELAAAGLGSWTPKAPIPTVRRRMAGAVVQNASGQSLFYTIGGSNANNRALRRVEAYNAATNRWIRKANLPADRTLASAATIGNKIYVVGGFGLTGPATKTLYVYNPTSNTWVQRASLPVPHGIGITGVIAGQLYLVTGASPQRLYRYNPATNAWTRLANLNHDHVSGIGGAIGGKLYVAWGRTAASSDDFHPSFTVDVYNPATNRWTTKLTEFYGGGECPETYDCSVSSPAGTVFRNQLYVIGGGNDDESMPLTFAYDPVANSWTRKADMQNTREGGPVAGTVRNSAGKLRIVVTGGFSNDTGEELAETEVYTP